jgi:signal transduction histidine kinase/ligand-binding sensor domain-containing protein
MNPSTTFSALRAFIRSERWFRPGLRSLLVACCFLSNVQAQFVIDSWTTENGLPQNSVLSIQQTPDGYLWLTTFDGLVRFDGVRFTVFNRGDYPGLPSNRFVQLLAERDGALWACTENDGFVRYLAGRFQTFSVANGLPSNNPNRIQRDIDGSLLIETHTAVAHLRAGRITSDPPRDFRERKTYVSPRGARWDLDATGLRRTIGGRESRFTLPSNVSTEFADGFYSVQMEETADGALWLALPGGLYRLGSGGYAVYTAKDGLPQSSISALAQDRQGGLWLATERDGACRFANRHFTCYTTVDGLSSNYVRSVFQDREGNIWVGTNDRGLNRLTRRVVTPLSTAAGLREKNVYSVLEDRAGDVWVGTIRGLARMRSGRVAEFFDRSTGLLPENVQSLYEDRVGRLWIGSDGGVEFYANGRFQDFTRELKLRPGRDSCWSIHEDTTGALWFGTNAGLLRYQGGQVRRYTVQDGLPGNDVKAVLESRNGSLWVGTYAGLACMDGTHLSSHFSSWTERDGLASNHIRAIHEDEQGTLWIGTYDGGLSRLSKGVFTNYTTAQGLFSNGVFQILEDARGNFWMSSNQGIYRVSRQQLEDVATAKISEVVSTAFGRSDGMLNAECNGGNQTAGMKSRDGKLWFPTQDGVAVIDPEAVPYNPLPPPVVIESGSVEGRDVPLKGGLQLQSRERGLEIRYTANSLVKPEQVRFRYRLEGLDTQWVEAGMRRSTFYPYLPPGSYVFRVIAANSDLVWNQNGAQLAIVVLPPFYRTWWFFCMAFLLVTAAAYLAWRRRIAQLQQAHATQLSFSRQLIESQEGERKRMAAELHDSLGQHLLVIKNRAALGVRVAKDQAQASLQFDEINASASQAIDEVRQITSNLRPLNLERLGATSVLEELIEKVSSASGIPFSADIMPLEGLLTPDGAIHLYRIIQESINNIVKHGQSTKASVEIWREDGEIHVTVADNGRGFGPEASVRRGLGLISIAERVRMLGGTHTLVSTPGRGTTLTVRIPAADLAKGATYGA